MPGLPSSPVRVTAVLAAAVTLSCAGCGGGGVDKAAYLAGNRAVLNAVPVFAGARVLGTTTAPFFAEGTSGTQGYTTDVRYRLPRGVSVTDVAAFYRRRLRSRWALVEVLRGGSRDGPVLNFCRGKAFVSINLQSKRQHILEIDSDHAFYGGPGRPPRCTGARR